MTVSTVQELFVARVGGKVRQGVGGLERQSETECGHSGRTSSNHNSCLRLTCRSSARNSYNAPGLIPAQVSLLGPVLALKKGFLPAMRAGTDGKIQSSLLALLLPAPTATDGNPMHSASQDLKGSSDVISSKLQRQLQ